MTDYDEAREVVERALAAGWGGHIERFDALAADDIEVVGRDGRLAGEPAKAYLRSFLDRQRAAFDIDVENERFIDAGDGTVVVFQRVRRRGKDPELGEFTAWPAAVFRIRDGRVAFFEGYQDRRKALKDLGLPEDA